MSVRRILLLGGTVAVLWATPAAALPAPPTVPRLPLPKPLGAAPVDHATAAVDVLVSPASVSLPEASPPALPVVARPGSSGRSMPRGARSPAREQGTTGGRPARTEQERAAVPSAVVDAPVDARPARVHGALDARSSANPWSPFGTASTSFGSWFALCALALGARWIAISAWRDAPRRRRTFNLR